MIFGISVLLLSGIGVYFFHNYQRLTQASSALERTNSVLYISEGVISLLKDAEVGQRGFLIVRDSSYLVPYQNSIASLPRRLEQLDSCLTPLPEQKSRMIYLRQLVYQRLACTEATLRVAGVPHVDTARLRASMGRGKRIMDSTRLVVNRIQEMEQSVLPKLDVEKNQSSKRTEIMLWMILLLSLGLFILTFAKMMQELVRRWKYEKRLEKSISSLRESNEQLETFSFVAAHHLQEPLRKLNVFSDRLISKYAADFSGDARFLVQRMGAAVTEMSQLIHDLHSMTLLGKVNTSHTGYVSLEGVLNAVLQEQHDAITQNAVKITLPAQWPTVSGDANQLKLLFSHLMSNALKFARKGVQPEINIEISMVNGADVSNDNDLKESKMFAQIAFSDNGMGFEPEHQDKIFELFQRLHSDKQIPGTGVGLAICKKIVANHKGHISAKSKPQEGTSFLIYLPL
jgi:signal transduction histidine kinase